MVESKEVIEKLRSYLEERIKLSAYKAYILVREMNYQYETELFQEETEDETEEDDDEIDLPEDEDDEILEDDEKKDHKEAVKELIRKPKMKVKGK